jgi:hypothetical protein
MTFASPEITHRLLENERLHRIELPSLKDSHTSVEISLNPAKHLPLESLALNNQLDEGRESLSQCIERNKSALMGFQGWGNTLNTLWAAQGQWPLHQAKKPHAKREIQIGAREAPTDAAHVLTSAGRNSALRNRLKEQWQGVPNDDKLVNILDSVFSKKS